MPAVGRQSDAGDEAHGNTVSPRSVIPGRREAASPESITTIVSMDSGPAPSGASRNDDADVFRVLQSSVLRAQLLDFGVARQIVAALAVDRIHHDALAVLLRGLADVSA